MPIRAEMKKLYPRCWKQISRYLRFYRANNRCEQCGAPNGQFRSDTHTVIVLTVAHLDHNPRNNYLSNLAVLCQRCHLAHDRAHHIQTRRRRKYVLLPIAMGQMELWAKSTHGMDD